jgi:hypothetical protein
MKAHQVCNELYTKRLNNLADPEKVGIKKLQNGLYGLAWKQPVIVTFSDGTKLETKMVAAYQDYNLNGRDTFEARMIRKKTWGYSQVGELFIESFFGPKRLLAVASPHKCENLELGQHCYFDEAKVLHVAVEFPNPIAQLQPQTDAPESPVQPTEEQPVNETTEG